MHGSILPITTLPTLRTQKETITLRPLVDHTLFWVQHLDKNTDFDLRVLCPFQRSSWVVGGRGVDPGE